jgi:hypothetical protein
VVRAVLLDRIDYAGLFPPAKLDMPGAVAEYASYLASTEVWALGRFVVSAARLDELAQAATESLDGAGNSLGEPQAFWPVSAMLGADVAADMERVRAFNATHEADDGRWLAQVQGIEFRASTPEAITDALQVIPDGFDRFVEIPIVGDARPLVRAIADGRARAKVRTGGTSADAFPTSDDLARFLAACVEERVSFKATAGLHHPLRGSYPLTYASDSPRGTMYGFVNVVLATAFLHAGESEAVARRVLEETDVSALAFDDDGVTWDGHRVSVEQILMCPMTSFGSCSFREPLDDLVSLGML